MRDFVDHLSLATHIQEVFLQNGVHNNADQGVEEHRAQVLPSRLVEERLATGDKGRGRQVRRRLVSVVVVVGTFTLHRGTNSSLYTHLPRVLR